MRMTDTKHNRPEVLLDRKVHPIDSSPGLPIIASPTAPHGLRGELGNNDVKNTLE